MPAQGSPASNLTRQVLILEDFPNPKLARALSPNGRAHWATRGAAKQTVQWTVRAALGRHWMPTSLGPVRITYRWVFPVRRKRDLDNHATGVVKAVQDALVRLGVIESDDSDCIVDSRTEIVYERGRRCFEIEIEGVGDAD